MGIKYITKKGDFLHIQLKNESMLLYYRYNRFILTNKRIGNVDTDELLSNRYLSNNEVIIQLIHLFKQDLDILEEILRNKHLYNKLVNFILEKEPNWNISDINFSYLKSREFPIRIFLNRDKFNKEAVKFLVSRYFHYFETQYALKEKNEYIKDITYIYNTYNTLQCALCAIKKDFEFPVLDVSNIELLKFLKKYREELYNG